MNERTQSLAEYMIMMFRDADNTVVMGSNSVGSDGNLAYLYAPEGNILQFSGIGILTAEGEQTQRIGLSPDIYVEPTIAGIREGRDELIEAAIQYIEKKNNSKNEVRTERKQWFMIYADHAATTKISETAKLAMLSAMEKDWYNPSSLYTPGQQASGTLMDARVRIARCLGCLPKGNLVLLQAEVRQIIRQFCRQRLLVKDRGRCILFQPHLSIMPFCNTFKKIEKKKVSRLRFLMLEKREL
mgnify:CR=1 FL=1